MLADLDHDGARLLRRASRRARSTPGSEPSYADRGGRPRRPDDLRPRLRRHRQLAVQHRLRRPPHRPRPSSPASRRCAASSGWSGPGSPSSPRSPSPAAASTAPRSAPPTATSSWSSASPRRATSSSTTRPRGPGPACGAPTTAASSRTPGCSATPRAAACAGPAGSATSSATPRTRCPARAGNTQLVSTDPQATARHVLLTPWRSARDLARGTHQGTAVVDGDAGHRRARRACWRYADPHADAADPPHLRVGGLVSPRPSSPASTITCGGAVVERHDARRLVAAGSRRAPRPTTGPAPGTGRAGSPSPAGPTPTARSTRPPCPARATTPPWSASTCSPPAAGAGWCGLPAAADPGPAAREHGPARGAAGRRCWPPQVPAGAPATVSPGGRAWGVELPVPAVLPAGAPRRLPHSGTAAGARWCSPTSTTMLLAFHGRLPEPADVRLGRAGVRGPRSWSQAARHVYDYAYAGAGNWSFNTAYAGRAGHRGVRDPAALAHRGGGVRRRGAAAGRDRVVHRGRAGRRGLRHRRAPAHHRRLHRGRRRDLQRPGLAPAGQQRRGPGGLRPRPSSSGPGWARRAASSTSCTPTTYPSRRPRVPAEPNW